MRDLHKLGTKLCRELARSERAAIVHARREARRLRRGWRERGPALALVAIATHAEEQRPRFEALMAKRHVRLDAGRSIGQLLSSLRSALSNRLLDSERAYRTALLAIRLGVDIVRLLREVALREHDTLLVRFCDEWLLDRLAMIERAEQALASFAEQPSRAIRSGVWLALEPRTEPASV